MILCVPQSKSILQASGTAVDVSTDFGPLEKQHTAVLQFLTRTAVQQRNVTSDLVAGIASRITFRVRSHILASRRVLRPSLARTVLATDVLEALIVCALLPPRQGGTGRIGSSILDIQVRLVPSWSRASD
eukprot:s470_g36.t1